MKKWLKYVKPYKLYFILGPLCMVVEVIGEILMPMFLGNIIQAYADGKLSVGYSMGTMAGMIAVALMMMLGGVGGAYFGAKASVNFAADVRNDVYRKVQDFSSANIDRFSSSSLVTRLTNDVTQIQNLVNMALRMMLRSPGMLIGALIMAIRLSPSLSVVLAIIIPVMLCCILLIVKTGFPRFGVMQKKIDRLNSTVQENVTNVRVVKSFVREDTESRKFYDANSDLKNSGMSAMKVMIFMQPMMTVFMNIATVAVIWFGSQLAIKNIGVPNSFSVGNLSSFILYISQILFALMMVTVMLMMSSRALASARRISEVLDEDIDIKNNSTADPSLCVEKGDVEFKNVTFRYYKNSEDAALESIDLSIAAGETVGIIGSTGCGKTTLVSMIARLYDVDSGEVTVDGRNVKDYTLHNLREGVGMVLQKNVLFAGTIEENLRWGNENATDSEVYTAAEYAQANKFVNSFTNGYDTELGQGGVNVSGGQKQRLCIARALLKKPKILILDDSTSAVDTATEAQIRRAFREELSGSTKIIIAQRISSVMDADKIVVMDNGRITGIGTHDELLANNSEYQEIYYSQNERKAGDN